MSSKTSSNVSAAALTTDPSHLKHKRRFCRHEGCNRIVKSQGLCQRHGATPRKCKVEGCDKQAQGNFDKMCKAHFKAMKRVTTPLPRVPQGKLPPPPQGFSVYDNILPASISFIPRKGSVMPLIAHLKAGFDGLKPPAWHRNEERRARGMHPIDNPATQLEGWERELVWMEILVLTGAPGASFRHLARAWGRDKGFHMVLAQFICERQGDVQRKKRIAERQGEDTEATADKSQGPAKKRRRLKKNSNLSADVADVWDDSAYGDVITNEALAANIFDFSPQEFESATALHRWKHFDENSDTASIASQRSVSSQAATTAILGSNHPGTIVPKPGMVHRRSTSKVEHPEQNPETSALILGASTCGPTPDSHEQFIPPRCVPPSEQNRVQEPHHQRYIHDGEITTGHQQQERSSQMHMASVEPIQVPHNQHDQYQHHDAMNMGHQRHASGNQAHLLPVEQLQAQQPSHQQYHQAGGENNDYQQHAHSSQDHFPLDTHLHHNQFHQATTQQHVQQTLYNGDPHQQHQQMHYQGDVSQQLATQYHPHQDSYHSIVIATVENQHLGQSEHHHQEQMIAGMATTNQEHQYPAGPPHGEYMTHLPAHYESNVQTQGPYEPPLDPGYHHHQQQQQLQLQQSQHFMQIHDLHQQNHNVPSSLDQMHTIQNQRNHPEQNPETSAIPPELAHHPNPENQGPEAGNLYNM